MAGSESRRSGGWNGNGPLRGVRVVELEGVGPVPFACMLLADMGAEILTVGAPSRGQPETFRDLYDPMMRGRARIAVDLKQPARAAALLEVLGKADVLLEGFRPGVTERLGLGPELALAVNPVLVYGRMTGYGQDGPMAGAAGHDPNYIGMTGALHSIGPRDLPVPPLNLVGDFAGGSLYLAMGVLAALIDARATGKGQVVDAAVVDGTASLMTMAYALRGGGLWSDTRADNLIDGGSPYARAYETADGRHIVVAAAEEKFYRTLLAGMRLEPSTIPSREDKANWPALTEMFARTFASRTRDQWLAEFEGKDACLTPVLNMDEAPRHPQAVARSAYETRRGTSVPAPSPRFSHTRSKLAPDAPVDAEALLEVWGIGAETRSALRGERK